MSTIQDQENADKFKGKVTNKSIKYLLNQHITENKKALNDSEIKFLQQIQDKLKLEEATVPIFERDGI